MGKNVKIDTGIYFQNPEFIYIDDNCWIDKNVVILAGLDKSLREKSYIENQSFNGKKGTVSIGKNFHVGIGCILSGIEGGIIIKDDCGLSASCRIYSFTHHYRSRLHNLKIEDFASDL